MSEIQELRLFLQALVSPKQEVPRRLPPALKRLVRRFVRADADVSDATQDLLLDLLVRTRRQQPGGVLELVKLDDARLLGALVRRLQQVLCEKQSRAKVTKSVRAMVRAALEGLPLPDVQAPPFTLMQKDKISAALVRAAVAYEMQQPGAAGDARWISARLLERYWPKDKQLADVHIQALADGDDLEEQVLVAVDAARAVEGLQDHVQTELLELVALRAAGCSLRALAERQGLGVSTVHDRLRKATASVTEHVRSQGYCRRSLESALSRLAA
jgi:DNA-directed RNA polymerase specialized sigma24 family protein